MNNNIFIPTKGANSWKEFLAEPEKHWKTGYSAKTLAYCWEDKNGFPDSIRKVLEASGLSSEMILAIPEYKVYLDTNRAPSQNDLFVLSRNQDELITIMVEGKMSEPFDKTIKDWNDKTEGKKNRLAFLLDKLELTVKAEDLYDYRYQLFHRTVSAILMAEKVFAKKAIMLIHSFSQENIWFEDFRRFSLLLNAKNSNPEINQLYKCKVLNSGIELYIGWVKGDKKYLQM